MIVIGVGGNDAFTLNTPRRWRKQVQALIADVQHKYKGVPIVFINMPPIKEFPAFTKPIKVVVGNLVEMLGQELQKIVRALDNVFYYARVITVDDWVERLNINALPSEFFSDGVHPSKLTYQAWAKDVAQYLNRLVR